MFVKIPRRTGDGTKADIFVNTDNVVAVVPHETFKDCTKLKLINGDEMTVLVDMAMIGELLGARNESDTDIAGFSGYDSLGADSRICADKRGGGR